MFVDIAAAIIGVALCWRCIADKSGATAEQVDEALAALRRSASMVLSLAPCDVCHRDRLLYRIRAPILGGSDDDAEFTRLSALIAAVILNRPMCLVCLTAKVDGTQVTVGRAMERISQTIAVIAQTDERCRACGNVAERVYSLRRRD